MHKYLIVCNYEKVGHQDNCNLIHLLLWIETTYRQYVTLAVIFSYISYCYLYLNHVLNMKCLIYLHNNIFIIQNIYIQYYNKIYNLKVSINNTCTLYSNDPLMHFFNYKNI